MTVVMEAFDGCFLDCPVHPFNLTVRPGMIGFRQTMFDPVGFADHVEAHGTRPGRIAITGLVSELDPIVGQDGVDPVRDDAQEMFEEFPVKRDNRFGTAGRSLWNPNSAHNHALRDR